ncbi:unnamed protein product [Ectocarpus sp. CCAP 1310/34]|nr:unnamed protein product [Ectocarpus sp. CCAP 1310/34]
MVKTSSWRGVWKALVNPADGSCGLYSMLQLLLMNKRSMSASGAEWAIRRAAGTPEMRELLMLCRRSIVNYVRASPDFELFFDDEGRASTDIFTTAELISLVDWEGAILKEGSYIDGIAVLVLGRIFGIPSVRIVHEVSCGGLADHFSPVDPVKATGQPTVLHSGGTHFEAVVPIAYDADTEVSAENDLGSAMEFCRQALDRHADDPVDDGAFVNAVISFVRHIPRSTGTKKRALSTRGIHKLTRGRRPLTRGRLSRFRDSCRGLRSIRGGEDFDVSGAPVIEGAATQDASQGKRPASPVTGVSSTPPVGAPPRDPSSSSPIFLGIETLEGGPGSATTAIQPSAPRDVQGPSLESALTTTVQLVGVNAKAIECHRIDIESNRSGIVRNAIAVEETKKDAEEIRKEVREAMREVREIAEGQRENNPRTQSMQKMYVSDKFVGQLGETFMPFFHLLFDPSTGNNGWCPVIFKDHKNDTLELVVISVQCCQCFYGEERRKSEQDKQSCQSWLLGPTFEQATGFTCADELKAYQLSGFKFLGAGPRMNNNRSDNKKRFIICWANWFKNVLLA